MYKRQGGILFAAAVNLFIVPLDLYSCGVVGIAQVLRTILVDYMHIPFPHQIDIAGILNFLINIPLFVLAYRSISHSFFVKTLVNVIVQTAALTFIMAVSYTHLDVYKRQVWNRTAYISVQFQKNVL